LTDETVTSKVCKITVIDLKWDPLIVTPVLTAPPVGLNESTHGPRNGALAGGELVQFAAAVPANPASMQTATSSRRTGAAHLPITLRN
jgi:hypothetical protein